MVSIALERYPRELHAGRDAYVQKMAHGSDGPLRLCKVLAAACDTDAVIERRSMGDASGMDPWRGFPWLTLILGSGCLDASIDLGIDPTALAATVRAALERLGDAEADERTEAFGHPVTMDQPGAAQRFTHRLVEDRLQARSTATSARRRRTPATSSPASAVVHEVPDVAARVCLLAHLVTRLYFKAREGDPAPVGRWDQDVAVFETHADARDEEVKDLIRLVRWHAGRALDELEQLGDDLRSTAAQGDGESIATVINAIANLVEDILGKVQGRPGIQMDALRHEVDIVHVRLITEIAWYLLTVKAPIYPGWTDLLFGLMLLDNTGRADHRRPRFYNLRSQARFLPGLLRTATQASWDQVAPRSETSSFYRAAAEVLWSQAHAQRTDARHDDGARVRLPPASAFVASFDLELEMALWRTAETGERFFMVMPVHVFKRSDDPSGWPCWLRAEVVKDDDRDGLDAIMRPDRWSLLASNATRADLLAGPHVVRVSGSPLIDLPAGQAGLSVIADRLEAVGLKGCKTGQMVLEHAVTLDEYLAVRLAEAELALSLAERSDAKAAASRALPAYLRSSSMDGRSSGTNQRFWMGFGVPVGDPAVRHRLISQITDTRMAMDRERRASRVRATAVLELDGSAADDLLLDLDAPSEATQDAMAREMSLVGFAGPAVEGADRGGPAVAEGLGTLEAPDESDGPDEPGDDEKLLGVSVNRRIGDDEANLLYWSGFDVVEDSAAAFTEDLRHYAHHVRARGMESWPRLKAPCLLTVEEEHR
jgi:hypothetical protein